tara:strand:- start:130 stop:1419 length:1290 start_codon:yes stop_codon:yes gene_type:complete
MQELERAKVIDAYAKGEIKAAVAALRLQISTRQVRRLQERFAQAGVAGIASKRRGKPSNNQLDAGVAQAAMLIVREHYGDFGPTLACEMLREHHDVVLSKETLRRLMTEAGLWRPRNERRKDLYQPRERRACLGELVQIDGSRHAWFEQRRAPCAVLVFIDDATGRILHLHFSETECTNSYFEALQSYLPRHGKPQALYADRAAVFRSPSANKHIPTQFQRAVDELGISLICANSPQAKGRVERVNRTLQDRLVKQMRLDEIHDIDTANRWVGKFIERYNEQFSRVARSQIDMHTPLRPAEDLKRILSIRETRKLSNKLTLQHNQQQYILQDEPWLRAMIGQPIAIHTYRDGQVELRANDVTVQYLTLKLPPRSRLTLVDNKSLHHAVDELAPPTRRKRPHRENQPQAMVSTGVMAAKKISAQKRVSSR